MGTNCKGILSEKWNYNNCLGALDGRHLPLKQTIGGGSNFWNYKKFHSILLLAVCDAKYKFIYANVGASGAAGDASTWLDSSLYRKLSTNTANLPDPEPLPNDDAFALQPYLMKPYLNRNQTNEDRIYNYGLSRARQTTENTFGLLQQRLRLFGTCIAVQPKKAILISMCGIVLHNLFLERIPLTLNSKLVDREDHNHQLYDGAWREDHQELEGINLTVGRNP